MTTGGLYGPRVVNPKPWNSSHRHLRRKTAVAPLHCSTSAAYAPTTEGGVLPLHLRVNTAPGRQSLTATCNRKPPDHEEATLTVEPRAHWVDGTSCCVPTAGTSAAALPSASLPAEPPPPQKVPMQG